MLSPAGGLVRSSAPPVASSVVARDREARQPLAVELEDPLGLAVEDAAAPVEPGPDRVALDVALQDRHPCPGADRVGLGPAADAVRAPQHPTPVVDVAVLVERLDERLGVGGVDAPEPEG